MVKIYTVQFNNPEFLRYQYLTFKKFLEQEHELICINNSFDKQDEKNAIEAMARELGIRHYFPEGVNHAQAGWSHQTAANWLWKKFVVDSNDISIILDHDMFPIKKLEIDESYDVTGNMQGKGDHIMYFHPGFIIANNTLRDKETVDFIGEKIDGFDCDSGGNWYHYIKAHPDLKIKGVNLVNICGERGNLDLLPDEIRGEYNEDDPIQICEDFMLHFRNGSNWAHTDNSIYNKKMEHLRLMLNNRLA